MSLDFCVQKVESTGIGFTYHSFHEFRNRIARYCGFPNAYPDTDGDIYKNFRWKEMESTHPMFPLMDHSDCDGEMDPDDCGKVGAHLKVLADEWKAEPENEDDKDREYDIEMAEKLSEVMLQCYKNDETLLFL